MKRILVIGLGRFGRPLAEALAQAGAEVIGLDENMALVEEIRDRIAVAAQADSTDPQALRAVGAAEVDAAVVAIGEDFEAEVLTVAALKELGVREIIARTRTERERRILELVGATRTVSVEGETARRLARSLAASVLDSVEVAEGISLIHWMADERVAGKRLRDTELRARWGLDLVAVRRRRPDGGESCTVMPEPDFALQAGDVLLLVGADARLRAFAAATAH
jgi:trk system potassium uptake protein TrkA